MPSKPSDIEQHDQENGGAIFVVDPAAAAQMILFGLPGCPPLLPDSHYYYDAPPSRDFARLALQRTATDSPARQRRL